MPKKYGVQVRAASDNKPAEILVHGPIGKSFWSDEGISGKEFTDALNAIPEGTQVVVGVNSQGGAVGEGLAIHNAISRRSADVTVRIDGYALSVASFFPLAAHKVVSPPTSIWMIHNAWSWSQGNAEQMRKDADMLETHDSVLVQTYAKRTGKTEKEIQQAMKDETWLTGAEAVQWGLADEESDNEVALDVLDFTAASKETFQRPHMLCALASVGRSLGRLTSAIFAKLSAQAGGAVNQKEKVMNRNEIIALLKSWGVSVPENATDEWLKAELTKGKPANVLDLKKELDDIRAEREKDRKARIRADVKKLIDEERIPADQLDKWIEAVAKDESILAQLQAMPPKPKAAEPVLPDANITADASAVDTIKALARFNEPVKAWQRGNRVEMKAIGAASSARANFFKKHAAKIHEALAAGTNTIDATLKRDAILQTVVEDFARRLLPLRAFATVFQNVPLEGTNKVQVPFYDLDAGASTSFKFADGYVAGDTVTDNREIQIGKRADADVLDDTKKYDRKYQGLSFSSEELARQPYLDIVRLARLKADKLASDILTHVLGIITAANYGPAAVTKAAALFSSDDVATLKAACKLWPVGGRSLILDSAYDAALLKDPAIKGALNYGGNEAIRQGRIPQLFGFDYYEIPTIPANGENLIGLAVFMSAIGYAQAPVPPAEEVRRDGTTYSIITHADSQIALEYRAFGDSQKDNALNFIEASYGFEKLNAGALKRLVSA